MKVKRSQIIFVIVILMLSGLIVIAFLPSPVGVETSRAERGPLRLTIDEEGEARAHDRFVIAAPVTGRLARVELREGDEVASGQIVAVIEPSPLDPREREEVIARVQSAEALKREAEEQVECARASYEQAKSAEVTSANEFEAARFKAQAAASEVRLARAGLIASDAEQKDRARLVRLKSTVAGHVLQVIEKSERVVAVGTPIIALGDPDKLEVVVDVLSTDAVKIEPGMRMFLEDWGGEEALRAQVRTVECSAFTKVSALGIEEQRVNIVADFVDPPGPLGDGYRVEARIVIWEGKDALKVPSSALFRQGTGWNVFVVENGKAHNREVEIGHRSQFEVEILAGVQEGEQVVLHPSNQIAEGVRVELR